MIAQNKAVESTGDIILIALRTTTRASIFIHIRYRSICSIPAYTLTDFTAISRIEAKKHEGWDILGDAIISICSSYLFTTEYQKQKQHLIH